MTPDEESCFRDLAVAVRAHMSKMSCSCSKHFATVRCTPCTLTSAADACAQATARAAEYDKAMEEVDVNAMELMSRRRKAADAETELRKLTEDLQKRIVELESITAHLRPGTSVWTRGDGKRELTGPGAAFVTPPKGRLVYQTEQQVTTYTASGEVTRVDKGPIIVTKDERKTKKEEPGGGLP